MKLKDVFDHPDTDIFNITNGEHEDELEWTIMPTKLRLIPDEEGFFLIRAKEIHNEHVVDCYITVVTPERIAETVVRNDSGNPDVISIYETGNPIIPAVASECFGIYELYKVAGREQLGIDVLRAGLQLSPGNAVIAEDMGYILRDAGRTREAIEAFDISAQGIPSSEFIYLELAQLYNAVGNLEKAKEYQDKDDAAGFNL